jgi:hypothetical protein
MLASSPAGVRGASAALAGLVLRGCDTAAAGRFDVGIGGAGRELGLHALQCLIGRESAAHQTAYHVEWDGE